MGQDVIDFDLTYIPSDMRVISMRGLHVHSHRRSFTIMSIGSFSATFFLTRGVYMTRSSVTNVGTVPRDLRATS